MTTEEYAEKNGWQLQPWSGQNSQDLKVWDKEFGENHKVLVGHDIFTSVVFYLDGHTSLRNRRRGPGDFISSLDAMIIVDTLKGKPWESTR